MNRRQFLKLAAGAAAVAVAVPEFARGGWAGVDYSWYLPDYEAIGARYARALAQSLVQTQEMIAYNILTHTFETAPAVTLLDPAIVEERAA